MNHSSNSRNEAFEIKINHERVNHQNESIEEMKHKECIIKGNWNVLHTSTLISTYSFL